MAVRGLWGGGGSGGCGCLRGGRRSVCMGDIIESGVSAATARIYARSAGAGNRGGDAAGSDRCIAHSISMILVTNLARPSPVVTSRRAIVTGNLKRLGPALPGL